MIKELEDINDNLDELKRIALDIKSKIKVIDKLLSSARLNCKKLSDHTYNIINNEYICSTCKHKL